MKRLHVRCCKQEAARRSVELISTYWTDKGEKRKGETLVNVRLDFRCNQMKTGGRQELISSY